MRERLHFLLLNVGHFLDHLFTLIFATVAALALYREWGLGYADLLKYATPGFFAFGVFALPAGWLADKWSRDGMMSVFFIGIGVASIATAFARTPFEIGLGLFVVGVFAAIYHPVGLAIVVEKWKNTGMRIAVNGVWGNLGSRQRGAAHGLLDRPRRLALGIRMPGVVSILVGIAYASLRGEDITRPKVRAKAKAVAAPVAPDVKAMLMRVSMIVFLTTAVSSIVFQSTTFALPKVFEERLGGISVSATALGGLGVLRVRAGLHGPARRRPLPRQGRASHGVRHRRDGAGRVLRHDAWSCRLGGAALRHGLHAGGIRPDSDQRLHDRPPGRGRVAGANLRRALCR